MANIVGAAGHENLNHSVHSEYTARSAPTRNGSAVISSVVAVLKILRLRRKGVI